MNQSSLDAYGKSKISAITAGQNLKPSTGLKDVVKADTKVQAQSAQEVGLADVTDAVKKLNDYLAPTLQTVEFSIDQESDRVVVKVIDAATQKVLRQIPNKEIMEMSKTLDKLQGLVIRQTA